MKIIFTGLRAEYASGEQGVLEDITLGREYEVAGVDDGDAYIIDDAGSPNYACSCGGLGDFYISGR